MQYSAYQSEADLLGTRDLPPLKQTLEEVVEEYNNGVVLKVTDQNRIIASVRFREQAGTVYIGKLMVCPEYRRQGLGKRLLKEVETLCPNQRYELFTSSLSGNNLTLYESVGYKEYKRKEVTDALTLVYLEKG